MSRRAYDTDGFFWLLSQNDAAIFSVFRGPTELALRAVLQYSRQRTGQGGCGEGVQCVTNGSLPVKNGSNMQVDSASFWDGRTAIGAWG